MNINSYDFESIHSMFEQKAGGQSIENYFKILEIDSNATNEQIKKAYRKMAIKYHPDKLQGVSDDIKKLAQEKFLKVKEAYEEIMKNK